MLRCGVKDYYEGRQSRTEQEEHIDRMENIRKLYSLAKETDTPGQDPRDALTEFLQLTALSNSELDSLLEKSPKSRLLQYIRLRGWSSIMYFSVPSGRRLSLVPHCR